MLRKIIKIDENKCNGCGLCVRACHEGAIGILGGKAVLLRDDYCDGLGDCLPACPVSAISFEVREAADYDDDAVKKNKASGIAAQCKGAIPSLINDDCQCEHSKISGASLSCLKQWPVQIKLLPLKAPYYKDADILIAADCSAYAYADFHNAFMKNRVTMIGCPKLDEGDYSEKLTSIFKFNQIRSVTVVRMEVPCCGGIQRAVETAVKNSGEQIPLNIITLSAEGNII